MVIHSQLGDTRQLDCISIISECEDTSIGYFQWQQVSEPHDPSTFVSPCILPVAVEPVDSNDALCEKLEAYEGEEWKGYSLDNGVMTSNKQFQTQCIASRFDRDLQLGADELITEFITQLYLILLVSLEVRGVMMAI